MTYPNLCEPSHRLRILYGKHWLKEKLGKILILLKDIRTLFLNKKFLVSILGIILLILPHIIWNINNGFVTFTHTAANANFKGFNFNLFQGIIFLTSQALIFGAVPVYLIIKRLFSLS